MKKIVHYCDDLIGSSTAEMQRVFGERAATLMQLYVESDSLTHVPSFAVIPIEVSQNFNQMIDYQKPHQEDVQRWYDEAGIVQTIMKEAGQVFNDQVPIMRATSSLEGRDNGLSFAGVCQSYIPRSGNSLRESFQNGVAKVLTSSYGEYGQYYFQTHRLSHSGHDVGQIYMDFVQNPLVHLTTYVFENHYFLRGFIQPIDRKFTGGFDIVVERDHKQAIAKLPGSDDALMRVLWKRLLEFLDEKFQSFYQWPCPIDMELLIAGDWKKPVIVPVQIRKVCDSFQSTVANSSVMKAQADTIINAGHLLFTVGVFSGYVNMYTRGGTLQSVDEIVHVVQHGDGQGTLDFLRALPQEALGVVVIVLHEQDAGHDHLQYAMYEDPRLTGIFHIRGDISTFLGRGVTMVSTGYSLNITLV